MGGKPQTIFFKVLIKGKNVMETGPEDRIEHTGPCGMNVQ